MFRKSSRRAESRQPKTAVARIPGLEVLSETAIEFWDKLLQHRYQFELTSLGVTPALSPKLFSSKWKTETPYVLEFLVDNSKCAALYLNKEIVDWFRSRSHQTLNFSHLNDADKTLVIEHLLTRELNELERYFNIQIELTSFSDEICLYPNPVAAFELQIHEDEPPCSFCFAIDEKDFSYWLDLLNKSSKVENLLNKADISTIKIPLLLNLTSIQIPIDSIRQFKIGDGLFFDADRKSLLNDLTVEVKNGPAWKANIENDEIILLGPAETLRKRNANESTHLEQQMTDRTIGTSIDGLNITLAMEIDRREMTLNELEQLKEGASIKFSKTDPTEVRLMANDNCIGLARLVSVEDGLAVQITRLFNHGS